MSLSVDVGDGGDGGDGDDKANSDDDNESNVVLGVEMAVEIEDEAKNEILAEMPGMFFFVCLAYLFVCWVDVVFFFTIV